MDGWTHRQSLGHELLGYEFGSKDGRRNPRQVPIQRQQRHNYIAIRESLPHSTRGQLDGPHLAFSVRGGGGGSGAIITVNRSNRRHVDHSRHRAGINRRWRCNGKPTLMLATIFRPVPIVDGPLLLLLLLLEIHVRRLGFKHGCCCCWFVDRRRWI